MISPQPVHGIASNNGTNASGSSGGFANVTIQQVSVCKPTINAIQVNGQVTNTVIAGTSGYMSLYGQCLEGASGVNADGNGIQFKSLQYSGDAQINAFFQSSVSATWGFHNVTVSTVNGTSADSSSAQVFVSSVTLQSFSFTNSVAYSRDCTGNASPISQPTWPAPTTVACPQIGYTGDHAVYFGGNTMAGTATFAVTPAPPQGVSGVYIQGTTGGAGMFTASGITIPAGDSSFPAPVTIAVGSRPDGSTSFPTSFTAFYAPMTTSWSVAQVGSSCTNPTFGCIAAGASANPVYVTLAQNVLPPILNGAANPVMLTYVALAVGYGGSFDQPSALGNTWSYFSTGSGPANVKTWDGRSMNYYTAGFNSCALNASEVVQNLFQNSSGVFVISPNNSAQCGAFALLLESALAMNGIHSNWTTVTASDASKMMIDNWGPSGSPTYPCTAPCGSSPSYYKLVLNTGDYMSPPLAGGYGDFTNNPGVAGQGEDTPVEKVFDLHFIVQIPSASGDQYYDPSYGLTYPDQTGFETQAVTAYAFKAAPDTSTDGNYHARLRIAGSPNITFTTLIGSSM